MKMEKHTKEKVKVSAFFRFVVVSQGLHSLWRAESLSCGFLAIQKALLEFTNGPLSKSGAPLSPTSNKVRQRGAELDSSEADFLSREAHVTKTVKSKDGLGVVVCWYKPLSVSTSSSPQRRFSV